MRLCIIGSGYVGLVSAACFAETGNQVCCVEINETRVQQLRQGQMPIYEPGLDDMVARNCAHGRLRFESELSLGLQDALIVFICVGTPQDEQGACDLTQVENCARQIGRSMQKPLVIATKSTVPVGTSARVQTLVAEELAARGVEIEFAVVSNPEFLREGTAVADFMNPDRVVLGVSDPTVAELMRELYSAYLTDQDKIMLMSLESSEMTKYAANAFLAVKVSFINEIANLCETMSADISDVRRGIGADERIGFKFMSPGVGYGGSCLPKDVSALIYMAASHGYPARMLEAAHQINQNQRLRLAERVRVFLGADNLSGRKIAVWGLSFKPETDDIRMAPALDIIRYLDGYGASISAFDPIAAPNAARELANCNNLEFASDQYAACASADALVVLTEWNQFRTPDFVRVKQLMRQPVIFDGRNLYNPAQLRRLGFQYFSIGRKADV